jgi:DnaJ-class molecular chaperone
MAAAKDYYSILGVSKSATEKEIKSAYRKLARKHHPDVNPGDKRAEDRFKEIAEAYEVLSDVEQRKKYDQFGYLGDAWRHAGEGGFGGSGQPGGGGAQWRQSRGAGGQEDLEMGADFADILGGLFSGGRMRGGTSGAYRRPQPTARPGEDVQYEVEITLEEAYAGTQRTLTLRLQVSCPTCLGAGVVNNQSCPTCGGTGVVERPKTLEVKIPRGVQDGAKIRVAGQGSLGQYGGRAGDLYLIPRLLPHARFERKGDDLYTEVSVSFPEAALGAEIDVPTMTGPGTARMPAGTSSGQSLRLRGKGMPHLRDEEFGDLYIKIRVMVPRQLSEREQELIEELRTLRHENPRGG